MVCGRCVECGDRCVGCGERCVGRGGMCVGCGRMFTNIMLLYIIHNYSHM